MKSTFTRRELLSHGVAGMSAAWVAANWPALISAASHARAAAKSAAPLNFEFFSSAQAAEVEAVAARIIPTTDTPGAREAGVVFFIDRALVTFAKASQKVYVEGLPELHARVSEMFPGTQKFSAATLEQQDQVLESLDEQSHAAKRQFLRRRAAAQSFFETIRVDTISGFLIDPDCDRRGNRDAAGWKAIGRDPAHMFQPPFGYYDKDYPGWQPNPPDPVKTKT